VSLRSSLGLLALGASVSACIEIAPPESDEVERTPLTCFEDADCPRGECDSTQELCVSSEDSYPDLLLEVVPSSTDERFGGRHFFHVAPNIARSWQDPALVAVAIPSTLDGVVRLAFPADLGCGAVAVKITLTPVQALLGLPAQRFVSFSKPTLPDNSVIPENVFRFTGVPAGLYDVYFEDAQRTMGNPAGCDVVPQVFRKRAINPGDTLELTQPAPRSLRVEIPWRDELAGWIVDVVHPATWETVSTKRVLSRNLVTQAPSGEEVAGVNLKLSSIPDDYIAQNDELLRIRPPAGVVRPTIYLVLSGLVVISEGVAQVGELETFALTRSFEAWVWAAGKPEQAVSGRVEFVAESLERAPEGLPFVRLRHVVEIDDDGKVQAELPPGKYTVRVYPTDSGLSVFETSVTIWLPPDGTGTSPQSGRVFEVPKGASLSGTVRFPAGLSAKDTLVEIQRQSAFRGGPLANPLSARGANGVAGGSGQFVVPSVDCRRCDREVGALYTLRVVPPEGWELPWMVTTPVSVSGETVLGELQVEPPLMHFGQLSLIDSRGNLRGFPGALIRAYALLDAGGVARGASTPSCVEVSALDPETECVRRAVLIGETRAGATGAFRLLLPPSVTPGSP